MREHKEGEGGSLLYTQRRDMAARPGKRLDAARFWMWRTARLGQQTAHGQPQSRDLKGYRESRVQSTHGTGTMLSNHHQPPAFPTGASGAPTPVLYLEPFPPPLCQRGDGTELKVDRISSNLRSLVIGAVVELLENRFN